MPKVSAGTLREVQAAFEEYKTAVKETLMSESSQWTYITHTEQFVRWLDDQFTPGSGMRLRRNRR